MRRRAAVLSLLALAPACGGDGAEPAARTVEMTVTDALRFDPAAVTASKGERVTFRIQNTGAVAHEFAIGGSTFHAEHRAQMEAGETGHGAHTSGGTASDLPPGRTTTVTFTMPDAAPKFACYVDKHADAGMVGTVTYGT